MSDQLRLHLKQGRAFESLSKITLCCSGIQGGKSTVGALWGLKNSFGWGPEDCAIIGAPTYKILNQSTLPTWLKYAGRFGEYLKGDQEFVFHDGFRVYIRTSTDPDSIEGIQNCRWFWMDEAGKCKMQFWDNAEGRCARTAAPLFLTTTPYGLNWPYKVLIKPAKAGLRSDVAYYEWLSIDNPTFPLAEYERQKRILDPRTFRRKYMGIHERMEGLVYDIGENQFCTPKMLPKQTRYFAAVDWGYAVGHEFALLVRAIGPDGFRYEVDEFKKSGLDPNQQIEACLAKYKIWGIETFLCDPARPDMISALSKTGVTARPFQSGVENYKKLNPGIDEHIKLINSGRYQIFREACPQLEDEYETYHWPEVEEDDAPADVPVKVNDHLMDCARMLTVGTMHVHVKAEREPHMTRVGVKVDRFDPRKKSSSNGKRWDTF